MADKTHIEWTRGDDGTPGATWNPITGCSVVSPGCTNCYAMTLIGQRLAIHAGVRPVKASEVRALLRALKGDQHMTNPCLIPSLAIPALERVLSSLAASPDTLFNTDAAPMVPYGHIVCTVIVGAPKRGDECAAEFGESAGNDSDREGTFNWGWPMLEVSPLTPPVQARGAQGLWDWQGVI